MSIFQTPAIDVHQHLWSDSFLARLSSCSGGPKVKRLVDGKWSLRLPNEPEYFISSEDLDLDRRKGGLLAAGIDKALLVPPLAIGVDSLESDTARELLQLWQTEASNAGEEFGFWAAVPQHDPQIQDLEWSVELGAVGLAVSTESLASAKEIRRFAPVFELLQERNLPLFVHPAPALRSASVGAPEWLPAVADYPGQLVKAWANWLNTGTLAFPNLRVIFTALAGGAPFQIERLANRGGGEALGRTQNIFYDTSSFGATTIDAAAEIIGYEQIAFGSDRPVVAQELQHAPSVRGLVDGELQRSAAVRLFARQRGLANIAPLATSASAELPETRIEEDRQVPSKVAA